MTSSLKQRGEKMNSSSNPISKTAQTKLEKLLLKVFKSDKRKFQAWLKRKLESMGVEDKFAAIIARYEGANEDLLELSSRGINQFIHCLIKEFKKAGFDEKIALTNLGRLRELERLNLPITARTIIYGNPQILLKNKKELKLLGLPVNRYTITRNPGVLLENKKTLESLGLPVNPMTILRNPQTLLENKLRLERLDLRVSAKDIMRSPQIPLS